MVENLIKKPSLIIKNANVISMNGDLTFNWISIKDGIIEALGNGEEYELFAGEETEVIDGEGKTVLPGLIDNHFHLISSGLNLNAVDLSNITNIEEMGAAIAKACSERSDRFILAKNLSIEKLESAQLPNRQILDRYCNSKPVVIFAADYHAIILNSPALFFFKIPFALSGASLDENGIPTGIFTKKAGVKMYANLEENYTDEECNRAIEAMITRLHSLGVTTIAAMEGGNMGMPPNKNRTADYIYKKRNSYPMNIELYYQSLDTEKIVAMGLDKIGGSLYVDGTFGFHSAALMEDYSDDEGNYFAGCDELNDLIILNRNVLENMKLRIANHLGRKYIREGQFENGLKILYEAMEIDPYDEETATVIIDALIEMNNRSKAVSFLHEVTIRLATDLGLKPSDALKERAKILEIATKNIGTRKAESQEVPNLRIDIEPIKSIDFFFFSDLMNNVLRGADIHPNKVLKAEEIKILSGLSLYLSEVTGEDPIMRVEPVLAAQCFVRLFNRLSKIMRITVDCDVSKIDEKSADIMRYMEVRYGTCSIVKGAVVIRKKK